MSSQTDAKIIDLIQAHAKEALTNDAAGSPQFQSLEFFPPRTPEVKRLFRTHPPALCVALRVKGLLLIDSLLQTKVAAKMALQAAHSADKPLPALV